MNFQQLWEYVKDKNLVVYVTLKSDNIRRGPLSPEKAVINENYLKKSKCICLNNADAAISIFEKQNNAIYIDETDLLCVDNISDYILVKCKNMDCEIHIE